ncbi:MAG: hypothetical protein IV097_24000 [Burkholderiaceae bacterium]|nr:hypothetical protein [Burkholderiaceae bacterium]
MSKGQHGNKEAKKPQKAASAPLNPTAPAATSSAVAVAARQQDKGKKR